MNQRHRQSFSPLRRLVIVVALGASVAVMFAPAWIEEVFRVSPDSGSGQLEWLFAAIGILGVAATSATGVRWRRAQRALLSNSNTETVTR